MFRAEDDRAKLDEEVAVQREVARVALGGVDGFVLAGSGAIREHGLIDRPTEDVDLFTNSQDVAGFAAAVDRVMTELRGSGYEVEQTRQAAQYARLHVLSSGGLELDVDLGVDWRQNAPAQLGVGPVLSLVDAIASKVDALYSRAEPRDFLDVDAIRASGRFSDPELLAAVAERDPGFDIPRFGRQLAGVRYLTLSEVSRYGISDGQLEAVKTRCIQWADELTR